MAYVQDQIVHDADSHLMELPDCIDPYFEAKMLARYHALPIYRHKLGRPGWAEAARRQHDDPAFRAGDDTPRARAGAMLVGETLNRIRAFLSSSPK